MTSQKWRPLRKDALASVFSRSLFVNMATRRRYCGGALLVGGSTFTTPLHYLPQPEREPDRVVERSSALIPVPSACAVPLPSRGREVGMDTQQTSQVHPVHIGFNTHTLHFKFCQTRRPLPRLVLPSSSCWLYLCVFSKRGVTGLSVLPIALRNIGDPGVTQYGRQSQVTSLYYRGGRMIKPCGAILIGVKLAQQQYYALVTALPTEKTPHSTLCRRNH